MALVPGVPGFGWKAQVVHAQRPGALIAAAPLAATALWARVTRDEGPAGRWLQRLSGAREAALAPGWVDPRAWHDYEIEWQVDEARFRVDGHDALAALRPPSGPLGFVLWIDTQYAVATPRGSLRFGALDASEQWLQVARLSIEPL